MLIDNKFYFVSIPRCASTSFKISCIKRKLDIKHFNSDMDISVEILDKISNLSNEEMADILNHPHESIHKLESKFGNGYDIISIKRNKHEQFISLWKHILDEIKRVADINSFNILSKLNEEDIFFYDYNDIVDDESILNTTYEFIKRLNIENYHPYLVDVIKIGLAPNSNYHNHNPKIKWFDFNKLSELEEWVSNKIQKDFKLEKINSSQQFETNLELNDNFIKKYNAIYDKFDIHKETKTLL